MESLALLVSIILLSLLACGPAGLFATRCRAPILGMFLGALAVIMGAAYLAGAPSAPSPPGLWAVGTGIYAVHRGMMFLMRS